MVSPIGLEAEKERSFHSFFLIFLITGHQTVPMKGGLNWVIAFTANAKNFSDSTANANG